MVWGAGPPKEEYGVGSGVIAYVISGDVISSSKWVLRTSAISVSIAGSILQPLHKFRSFLKVIP